MSITEIKKLELIISLFNTIFHLMKNDGEKKTSKTLDLKPVIKF